MARPDTSRAVALSAWVYRALLRLYPAAFRRAYGRDMARVFRDACRDAHSRAGARGVLLLWLPILGDLLVNAVGERVASLRDVWEGETIVVVEGNARRALFRWWVVVGALSFGLPAALSTLLQVGAVFPPTYVPYAVAEFVAQAAVLAIGQWLIVRRYVSSVAWWAWAWATIMGVALTALIEILAYESQGPRNVFLYYGVGAPLEGLSVGLAQWFVLRRYVPRAGWWVAASVAGWVVAVAVGIFITLPIIRTIGPGAMSTDTWRTFFVVVAAVCGSLYGAFLGHTLVVLLRPKPGAIPS